MSTITDSQCAELFISFGLEVHPLPPSLPGHSYLILTLVDIFHCLFHIALIRDKKLPLR